MSGRLRDKIIKAGKTSTGPEVRMATVTTAPSPGSDGRMTCGITFDSGVTSTGVPIMSGVWCTLGQGVWVAMMGRGRQLVLGPVQGVPPSTGRVNWVDNGDFQVNQRNAGSVDGTNYNYPADRWCVVRAGFAAGANFSRLFGFPDANPLTTELSSGYTLMRYQRTAGNTSTAATYMCQGYDRETVYQMAGRYVTLSFTCGAYADSTSTLNVYLIWGTGNSRSALRATMTSQTNALAANVGMSPNLLKKYISPLTLIPSNATELEVRFEIIPPNATPAGTFDIFDFRDVQLQIGPYSPMERLVYTDQYTRCAHYYVQKEYWKMNGVAGSGANPGIGRMGSIIPIKMRDIPTLAIINGPITIYDGANTGTIASITTNHSRHDIVEFDAPSTLAAGGSTIRHVQTYVGGSWLFAADAEIK